MISIDLWKNCSLQSANEYVMTLVRSFFGARVLKDICQRKNSKQMTKKTYSQCIPQVMLVKVSIPKFYHLYWDANHQQVVHDIVPTLMDDN